MHFSFDFLSLVEDVHFSENGMLALLISHSRKTFWVLKMGKKNEIKTSFQSETKFSNCRFDASSQNIILVFPKEIQVFSVRLKKIIQTIDFLSEMSQNGQDLLDFTENQPAKKMILKSKMRII